MPTNDRVFTTVVSYDSGVELFWAAASGGIVPSNYDGSMQVWLDGRATIFWRAENDDPYVLVIDPSRRHGWYIAVYESEDQPPDETAKIVWSA